LSFQFSLTDAYESGTISLLNSKMRSNKRLTSEGTPGKARVVIEGLTPEVDGGQFPIKRIVGETVVVEADIFVDGYDAISALLRYRKEDDHEWTETPMESLANDHWRGSFVVTEVGRYCYSILARVDRFQSWRRDLAKKLQAGRDVSLELLIGAQLLMEAGHQAGGGHGQKMGEWADVLQSAEAVEDAKIQLALSDELLDIVSRYPDRQFTVTYPKELVVVVDRQKARFSAWYEMFPRSCAPELGRHGTFSDCVARLPYIAAMGFDVLYLPPIHPIGHTHRKGKNNSPIARPDDPGTPWAIGSEEGGHKSVHPQLGSMQDFRDLVTRAREYEVEIALDIAFQCSPDHLYVREHPEWFRWRPDKTIQFAENPPKKYEDIYPFDFETDNWQGLWQELRSIVTFWIEQGIRIFRVDNPHTKPFDFWQWLIAEIKKSYPDVIFLSEAFTRPKVMYRLAKLGFAQSYTYFAWRNTGWELTQYFTELTKGNLREYFHPNVWPNTPDILTEYLQFGGRPAFMARLVLAATLAASYGIYGPAFELCEHRPKEPGSEEYLNSEKYEIKNWDISEPDSLKDFIARVNRIRRENLALQGDWSLRFHEADNEQLLCYSKHTDDFSSVILVVVNLDPHHTQSGWVEFPLEELGIDLQKSYQMHDLLSDARYLWRGARNFVELNPQVVPAHIFRMRRRVRAEQDFDYYM
jgi:starch synthase (maltosyl-transferring)